MKAKVFLDTSYAIALSSSRDQFHKQALRLAEEIEAAQIRLLTTRAVLLEIGNALAKPQYRRAAIALLDALEGDSSVEIVPLTEVLYSRALSLYRQRLDKAWGLVDCISFVIMRDDEEYLGVQFRPSPLTLEPGESANLILDLMYHPSVEYDKVAPGSEFTLREGGKIVGFGQVLDVNFDA